jgi:2-oxoglutarate ferredoxin oxidoreductase subunit gamma
MTTPASANKIEKDPLQIRLSGAGGQGLITAGIILAEAAVLDGKNAVQTQSYGPEARLGASKSEVIISSRKIAYPQVTKPDILLCLSQDAYEKYAAQTNPDTVIILDSGTVECKAPDGKLIYQFPITEAATKVGSKVAANVVALGVIGALVGLVTSESLRRAVTKRVPERFRALNEKALEAGARLVESARVESSQAS